MGSADMANPSNALQSPLGRRILAGCCTVFHLVNGLAKTKCDFFDSMSGKMIRPRLKPPHALIPLEEVATETMLLFAGNGMLACLFCSLADHHRKSKWTGYVRG